MLFAKLPARQKDFYAFIHLAATFTGNVNPTCRIQPFALLTQ